MKAQDAPFLELLSRADAEEPALNEAVPRLLRAIRTHLGMDIAFVSEFTQGRRVFRFVDSDVEGQPLRVGEGEPLEQSYCARVVDGRLPELIQDARRNPEALELPVTCALPVGAHLSVPLRLSDGSIYGTFCCFSFAPDYSLNERDLGMLRVFAEVAADQIDRDVAESRRSAVVGDRILNVLRGDGLRSVYQPIVDLATGEIGGYECLSRFPPEPRQGPDIWFAEATTVGLGAELEAKAIEQGLGALRSLPEHVYLSVNASPKVLIEGTLEAILRECPKTRLVLEITEHEIVKEYETLAGMLQPLRKLGMRIAVDDAGAGFASFRHILRLQPDMIKLDMSLTRNIHADPSQRALAAALIGFAAQTGSQIVAEGVETALELETLKDLGAAKGQGYYFGKPGPLP